MNSLINDVSIDTIYINISTIHFSIYSNPKPFKLDIHIIHPEDDLVTSLIKINKVINIIKFIEENMMKISWVIDISNIQEINTYKDIDLMCRDLIKHYLFVVNYIFYFSPLRNKLENELAKYKEAHEDLMEITHDLSEILSIQLMV